MKSLLKLLMTTAIVLGFGFASLAQSGASAVANTTATIVTPIAISWKTDLEFGNVTVHGTNLGTVVMDPASGRSVTGGCTLPAASGTTTAAEFEVTGVADYTYTITLPASVVISNGTENMTVNTFTSNPTPTGTLTGGTEALFVGATLNVAGGQAAGDYESATDFEVTVAYN